MDQDNVKEIVNDKKKEKWYEVHASIEAMAVKKDVVEASLKAHIDKMTKVKQIFIHETEFLEAIKVEKPVKNVDEAFSQIVRLKFFAKDLLTLLSVVMTYGPSSVEIVGPDKKEIGLGEAQNISNLLAGVVHQFASAGAGGIIITPEK